MSNNNYNLIILTGKTASGKDTVKQALSSRYPNLKRVITTTSRKKRDGEEDRIDYYFVSRSDFEKMIRMGDFLEYVEYGGNLYGTTKKELESALRSRSVIWKIDPSRAGEIRNFLKKAYPKSFADEIIRRILVIYITTSDDVILQRLKSRNLSVEEIEKRMDDDKNIWRKYKNNYDYILENVPGKLYETVDKIITLLESKN